MWFTTALEMKGPYVIVTIPTQTHLTDITSETGLWYV